LATGTQPPEYIIGDKGPFDKLTAGLFGKLTAGLFDKLTAGPFDKLTAGPFDKLTQHKTAKEKTLIMPFLWIQGEGEI
jgi:hypothetical protein